VISEASAFGLPILAPDTGGLRGSITEGVNGYLLPANSDGRAYATQIMRVIADPVQYEDLVVSSRTQFENHLNWDAWGRSMRAIMERILGREIDPGKTDTGFGSEYARRNASASKSAAASEPADSFAAEVSHT
jgi:hypothetical protein